MKLVRFCSHDGYVREGTLLKNENIKSDRSYEFDDVQILPPCEPTKIVCIGLNHQDHIDETDGVIPDRPMLFLKGANAVTSHGNKINLLDSSKRFDYEGEFGAVIGKQCRSVSQEQAMEYVRGFTCVNDLSNRDDQHQEQNWVRGKAFDNAAPIGPVLTTPEEVPNDAKIETRVNNEIRQNSSRDQLLFSVPELIEEISHYMTLEKGDVIATGTPRGVGPIQDGDTVEVRIEGVGTLRNEFQFENHQD